MVGRPPRGLWPRQISIHAAHLRANHAKADLTGHFQAASDQADDEGMGGQVLEREREVSVLAAAARDAAGGAGSVVLVYGEAGIGKSTLV
ncbi:MAG: AAA family ATPase, partial [Nocardioidaceae bacterium]